MVLIICTKNESNLTDRYWDMIPDRQKVWTDGRTDDAKTISLRLRLGIINSIIQEHKLIHILKLCFRRKDEIGIVMIISEIQIVDTIWALS